MHIVYNMYLHYAPPMPVNRKPAATQLPSARTGKDALYESLKSAILTLRLTPGADLDEQSLCDEFELSRTPLREVFRQLAGEGYVELRENRGARVTGLDHTTLHEFFVTAPMIYGAVLRLAARQATPAQIQQLKSAQRTFKRSLKRQNSAARSMANYQFHAITGDMAHNTFLLPSFKRLLIDHARIGTTFFQPGNTLDESVNATQQDTKAQQTLADQHHDQIIEAIEQQDENTAANLATAHWNLSRHQIERYVMADALTLQLGETA